jgi:peptidoglycan/LPS O-acetylase OafA/YrhL
MSDIPGGVTPPILPGVAHLGDDTRWTLIASGALMAIGAFLPWARAGIFTLAGTDGDGIFPLIGGVLIALIGVARKASTLGTIVVLIIALGAGWITLNVYNGLDPTTIGGGLYVSLLGCGIAVIAAFMVARDSGRTRQASKPLPPPTI